MDEKDLVKYFRSLGLEVHTSTKARGHQGFFMKNRIDISKNVPPNRIVPTLLHEFAHYIHSKLEKDINKSGGTLEILFLNNNPVIREELIKVTHFVDENSLCIRLLEHRARVKERIKALEKVIKEDYPKFLRSKKFKEFDKYIRRSKARYLLKYDRVKLISGFFGTREEVFTIDNLEKDFPDMQQAFCAYIRLRSAIRKQTRISARINKYKKYYERPTELFARFVEGLYLDKEWTQALAPTACRIFYELLVAGHYMELQNVFRLQSENARDPRPELRNPCLPDGLRLYPCKQHKNRIL